VHPLVRQHELLRDVLDDGGRRHGVSLVRAPAKLWR
jgi:hypothetical protein